MKNNEVEHKGAFYAILIVMLILSAVLVELNVAKWIQCEVVALTACVPAYLLVGLIRKKAAGQSIIMALAIILYLAFYAYRIANEVYPFF